MSDPAIPSIFFDGLSSRKRSVVLTLGDMCRIHEDGVEIAAWSFAEIRRADAPVGRLRLSCLGAPPLARLEIIDATQAADLLARCPKLDDGAPGGKGAAAIVGWSLAALVSIVLVVVFGVPLAADRLTPLVPQALERRLGEATDRQVKVLFDGERCTRAEGQAAFSKLVGALREAGGLDAAVDAAVIAEDTPNAFALPGGKIYLFKGLLEKADNADEIAGVLAHELGHVQHRDGLRNLIYNGGTSFLVGLLFGDVTGSSALIFATRTLFNASYSREVEDSADASSIAIMQKLGRSPKPMGELLLRVTGNERKKSIPILSSHPLSEDRLARMSREDRAPTAPPILNLQEWAALKAICDKTN